MRGELENDPTALRRTFAGFATKISGSTSGSGRSGRRETRGRFLIEIGTDEGEGVKRDPDIRSSVGTMGSLYKRLDAANRNILAQFAIQDRWKRRRRDRFLNLLPQPSPGSSSWNHLGSITKSARQLPKLEPVVLKPGQMRRAAEFPGAAPPAPIVVNSDNPAAVLTRRALTTLLPGSSSKRKFPDIAYTLHTILLMVIDEREGRACLILHVVYGLSLPPAIGASVKDQKFPDFTGSLSSGLLRKKSYTPYLNRIFLLALEKGMDSLCQMIIEAGFPKSFDDPIFTIGKGPVAYQRKALPSYFILAVALKRCFIAKLMIAKGVNLSQSWLGLTPLFLAACGGEGSGKSSSIMVKILLEAGADPSNAIGLQHLGTLQKYARLSPGQQAVVRIDRSLFKRVYPLDVACASDNCDAVINLLNAMAQKKVPVNSCQLTLLCQSDLDITIRLIKAGAFVGTHDADGNTPLHLAARAGKTEILAVLLHAGANIDAVNRDGWSPLHEAASNGHHDSVKYLISKGADCSIESVAGESALQIALKNGIPADDLCDYFGEQTSEESSHSSHLSVCVAKRNGVDYEQQDDIDELLHQVDSFQLSSEVATPRKNKRRFLIEKIIAFPKLWIGSSSASNNAKMGGDREAHCK